MLHSLKIKNFYSFREESVFSLDGGKTVQGDNRFMTTQAGSNLARVAVIFGANASGKTNFLKAISFLNWFINYSWRQLDAKETIKFLPFKFTEEDTPVEFEIITESFSGNRYIYSLTATPEYVISESLRVRKKGSRVPSFLFSREKEMYHRYPLSGFSLRDIPTSIRRRNASFIATVKQIELTCFDEFIRTINILQNVTISGRFDESGHVSLYLEVMDKDKQLRNKVEQELYKYDTGIRELDIQRIETSQVSDGHENSDDTIQYSAYGIHRIDDKEYKIPIERESNGSRQLIILLTWIFTILDEGGILVYDELEHSIHPNLLPLLLDLFYSEEMNPKNAQLICTCHDVDLINTLHKKQIFIVEKNRQQESELYPLIAVQGVRNDDNIMRKYLSGTYGGIPNI